MRASLESAFAPNKVYTQQITPRMSIIVPKQNVTVQKTRNDYSDSKYRTFDSKTNLSLS